MKVLRIDTQNSFIILTMENGTVDVITKDKSNGCIVGNFLTVEQTEEVIKFLNDNKLQK